MVVKQDLLKKFKKRLDVHDFQPSSMSGKGYCLYCFKNEGKCIILNRYNKSIISDISQALDTIREETLREIEELLPYQEMGVGFTDRFYKLKTKNLKKEETLKQKKKRYNKAFFSFLKRL